MGPGAFPVGTSCCAQVFAAGWGQAKRIRFLNWRLAGKWRFAPGQLGISLGDVWKEVKHGASFGQHHRDIVEHRPMHRSGQRSAARLHLPKQLHCIGLGSAAPAGSPLQTGSTLSSCRGAGITSCPRSAQEEGAGLASFWCWYWLCPAGAASSEAPKWVGEGGLS